MPLINTANTEQFYRPGMYEALKNMRGSIHGRGKKGRKTTKPHGIHGHGRGSEPHYADVYGNKFAGGRSGKGGKR